MIFQDLTPTTQRTFLLNTKGSFSRNRFRSLDRANVKRILGEFKKEALWVCPKTRLDIIKADPEDNRFLECAEEAKADFLITGNTKHFPFRRFRRTHIVSPAEFLILVAKSLLD